MQVPAELAQLSQLLAADGEGPLQFEPHDPVDEWEERLEVEARRPFESEGEEPLPFEPHDEWEVEQELGALRRLELVVEGPGRLERVAPQLLELKAREEEQQLELEVLHAPELKVQLRELGWNCSRPPVAMVGPSWSTTAPRQIIGL